MENSIEEALKKLTTGKKMKIYELLRTFKKEGIENFVITRKKYVDVILSDYKRVLKENEKYRNSDYETICLENNELREITDRIQSEYNDLLKDNFRLKNELETKRKEYQETYKDVREELRELKKDKIRIQILQELLDKEE